ncbi:MAG: DNA gyrase subunit A [Saprospiraceae bacterium]
MSDNQKIIPINIEDQMKTAYIDYSMSVIVSRALPDVRDGLKPVHRRVLYGMSELGMSYNKAHKKSARIVGEVLGKYHPHGDSSVYDTMVRMAQDWSLRYPLVDGQGNFGSMDGDSPAAMRYTEARLKRITDEMLNDLEKDTVDYKLNFDDTLEEPTVLPTKLPNLLINGSSGIAVGMATNMMPHNLSEVVDAIVALVDDPELTTADLMQHVKAPDFPTGGIIYGMEGVREGFETGRGKVVVRGRAEIETSANGKETIIVSEIPYQVNKAMLVAKIAELVNDKKILGISDIRDESDRTGLRIVIEIRRDSMANVVLSNLYKYTPLQSSYGINNVCLVNGRPRTLGLKDLIKEFIKFRLEVIVRRTKFELRKAEERAHILEGLLVALDDLDRIIELIRASKTVDEAHQALISNQFRLTPATAGIIEGLVVSTDGTTQTYQLTDVQAKAILEMRLQRLTGLEREKIQNEYEELQRMILRFKEILASELLQREIIKEELLEIKSRFGDERRTEISFADGEISIEDMMSDDEMVITISHLGYIKRTNSAEYRTQSRGGRGSKGAKTRDEDFVEQIFVATNHDYLLFFTASGKCHWLQVYQIPEASKTSAGRVVQNILNMPMDDKIRAYIRIDKDDFKSRDFVENHYIIFCTVKGLIKKTSMADYSRPRNGGILAISINEGDRLLEAKLTNGDNEIIIAARAGKAIRFNEKNVRPMGRTATGVRAITLNDGMDDSVIGMVCVDKEDIGASVFVLSEKGVGKRSAVEDYPTVGRGGKGVKTIQVSDKTGNLIAVKNVKDEDDLMVTCKSGIIIRISCADFRVMGRATQGVRVLRLDEGDQIADVTVVLHENEEEEIVIVDGEVTDITTINEAPDTDNTETSDTTETTDDSDTTE